MTRLKKEATRALFVWVMTYASGVIILLMIRAEHPFVMALLPTLATVYSNFSILKKTIHAGSAVIPVKRTTDMIGPPAE